MLSRSLCHTSMGTMPTKRFWELYNKLPQELKDAIFADETGENLVEICSRYEQGGQLDFVMEGATEVLLGVLPPNDFLDELEKRISDKAAARKVIHEINRFVFYPVKAPLEEIYSLQLTPIAETAKPGQKPPAQRSAYQEPL